MNPLQQAALARAREGAYLLPIWWTDDVGVCQCPKGEICPLSGKHPLTAHGLKYASKDSDTITNWWERWPRANVGERTDEVVGIDIDLVKGPRGS